MLNQFEIAFFGNFEPLVLLSICVFSVIINSALFEQITVDQADGRYANTVMEMPRNHKIVSRLNGYYENDLW